MALTPEQASLLALESAISAYKKYGKNDPLKNTRVQDWESVAIKLRQHLSLPVRSE